MVIEPQFARAEYFYDGLARVSNNEFGSTWGYIDKTGKFIYATKFEFADDFSDGLALVFYENKYAYLTPTGKIAFEAPKSAYFRLHSYSEGLAAFCVKQGCGFMDKKQKVVIKPRKGIGGGAAIRSEFHNGRAGFRSQRGDKKYGFIDKTGQVAIEPVWDEIMNFSNGVAVVTSQANGKAVIDTSGKVIIDFKKANIEGFVDIGSFHEGLGRIKILAPLKRLFARTLVWLY